MNYKTERFRSAEERKREANFCKHYRAIGIPAVIAATALSAKKREVESDNKSPKQ